MARPQLVGFVGGLVIFLLATFLILSWGAPFRGEWVGMLAPIVGILVLAGMSFLGRRLLIPALLGTGFVFTLASDGWWRALEENTATARVVPGAVVALFLDVTGIALVLAGLVLLARDLLKGR